MVVEDIAMPLAVRVSRRLVLFAERYGEWTDRSSRMVDVRQEQLATMLSVSRQTVNQALKELEAKGLVRLAYGKVEIVDLEALRRLATT
jgi:CRP-like cAMP-binding protein